MRTKDNGKTVPFLGHFRVLKFHKVCGPDENWWGGGYIASQKRGQPALSYVACAAPSALSLNDEQQTELGTLSTDPTGVPDHVNVVKRGGVTCCKMVDMLRGSSYNISAWKARTHCWHFHTQIYTNFQFTGSLQGSAVLPFYEPLLKKIDVSWREKRIKDHIYKLGGI